MNESIEYNDEMACMDCALKHMSKAKELYKEYLLDGKYELEYVSAIGNIGCAEDHLLAISKELAGLCRDVRLKLMDSTEIEMGEFDDVIMLIVSMTDLFKKDEEQTETEELFVEDAVDTETGL